jgi:GT2 family glycosyltransferase
MIAVIVPSKTASNIEACVAAKLESEPRWMPLYVIDDGIGEMPSVCDGSTVIQGIRPFIFARAINQGISEALKDPTCKGVVLLNDDALLKTRSGFTMLSEIAESDQSIGVLAPVTNVTGQRLQMPRGVGLRQVPHIAFVCVYIPRRTIERIGLLDERYCLDYGVEDRDYCEAVNRAGLKVCVHDDVFVDHGSLVSSFRGDPKTSRSFAMNWGLFQQKWGVSAL